MEFYHYILGAVFALTWLQMAVIASDEYPEWSSLFCSFFALAVLLGFCGVTVCVAQVIAYWGG